VFLDAFLACEGKTSSLGMGLLGWFGDSLLTKIKVNVQLQLPSAVTTWLASEKCEGERAGLFHSEERVQGK